MPAVHDAASDGAQDAPRGVVILGGAHGALALARSLGARGISCVLVTNDTPLPGWSRFVRRTCRWRGPDLPGALDELIALARDNGLANHLLVAATDLGVEFVAREVEALRTIFHVELPGWQDLREVCEKPRLYRRAEALGVAFPRTYDFTSVAEAAGADIAFPVVLKPAIGGGRSELAMAKVIRADDRAAFMRHYEQAVAELGCGNIVVQQVIPGGGEAQFSYAALWHDGHPVGEFMARRTRQYPVDFGYTSTFVEVVDLPEGIEASRKILASIGFRGLVEIEFKRDARDGRLCVPDVNPRPWSWFGLAQAAGVDLGAIQWDVACGRPVAPVPARIGVAWMYLVRDFVSTCRLRARGDTTPGFFASLRRTAAWATYAGADPLPGVLDLPLTAWRVVTRRVLGMR